MKKLVVKSKLRLRMIIFIISICVIFGVLLVYVSTHLYERRIVNSYVEYGNNVAVASAEMFPGNSLEKFADIAFKYNRSQVDKSKINEVVNSDEYKNAHNRVEDLRRSLNCNDIYICVLDLEVLNSYDRKTTNLDEWNPLYYVSDTHVDADLQRHFADKDRFSKYIEDIIERINSGGSYGNSYPANGRYGYTMTLTHRVYSNDKFVVLACCDISIENYHSDIMYFIITTTITVFILMLALVLVSMFVLSRYFVEPIVSIANDVKHFAGNEGWSLSSLKAFKTGDEIEMLAQSILKMQQNMFEYMDDAISKAINLKKVRTELNLAKSIQEDMLPAIFPESTRRNNFDLDASMTPAKEVGGDFYDFFFYR